MHGAIHNNQPRVHEAPSLPCAGCGAALPIDPTTPHTYCGYCPAWRPVPHEWWQQARAYAEAIWSAKRAEAAHAQDAEYRRRAARRQELIALGIKLVIGLGIIFCVPLIALSVIQGITQSVSDDYELSWPVYLGVVGAATVLTLFGVAMAGAAVFACYRVVTRHSRRNAARSGQDWFDGSQAFLPAMCGSCGGPLEFQVGEAAVTCGHCRNVVVATQSHKGQLIQLALSQVQQQQLERERAARRQLLAALSVSRSASPLKAYARWGALVIPAIPVLLAAYLLRTVIPSVEQAMLELAAALRGEFSAGPKETFAWLDAYWLGTTPHALTSHQPSQSRWNTEAIFHDRPVLITVRTGWSDQYVRSLTVLLARPAPRHPNAITAALGSHAARHANALGFEVTIDGAGVTLQSTKPEKKQLALESLSAQARCAYELAEMTVPR